MGDTTDEPIVKRIKLRGAAQAVMKSRAGEVLLAGPAGTGKSYAALLKVHLMCLANPGMRALMVRQTHKSLTSTGLVTYRDHVAKDAIEQGIVYWYGGSMERPSQYIYTNGSVILVGGMDNPEKVMSLEIDVAYVQEATELTKDGWEKIGTRLRNGVVSFQQLIADCNPQQPTHWLKQRADEGVTTMLYSRHEDNPRLFGDDGVVTEYGASYIARLDALTGVRKERLRWGRWAAAEGLVYEGWDPATHILDLAACGLASTITKRLPNAWRRVWSVDFGYTNPFVWQQWAIDGDGRMYLEEEIYRTQTLVEDHAKAILDRVTVRQSSSSGGVTWLYPKPHAIICDHDAEDRATLEKHLGMGTVAATKTVSDGIQAVQTRLRAAGDGKPRLYVLRDSRGAPDPRLSEGGKPTRFADEIEGYVWEPDKDGKPSKDTPLKLNDHACFAAGTAVLTERGERPIELIRPGERVWTRAGWCRVLTSGMTAERANVLKVALSSGRALVGTANHPVLVSGRDWARMDSLRYGDRLDAWEMWNGSSSAGSPSGVTPRPGSIRTGRISPRESLTVSVASSGCTKRFGSRRTARYLTTTTFTTSTSTRGTTSWATSGACLVTSIESSMSRIVTRRGSTRASSVLPYWNGSGPSPRHGIRPKRDSNFTGRTVRRSWPHARSSSTSAIGAGPDSSHVARGTSGSARTPASPRGVARRVWTTWIDRAPGVERCSGSTVTARRSPAPVRVLSVRAMGEVPVYNLTVEGEHEYLAEGVIVHNCDAARYAVAYEDLKGRAGIRGWL